MIKGGGNCKRPFEGERSSLTDELTFPAIPQNRLMDEPIILEGRIEDHQVRRILVDGKSSSEIMYEHCFRNLNINIWSILRRCRALLIGRIGMRSLRAVGFTIHSMIKFPTNQGIMTMETSREALWECRQLERVQGSWKEVTNTIPVKLANGTWKVQVDYSSLNKVRAKDMYPFSEEGEKLASLMEYPYKCFLRLPKENSQIRMAKRMMEKVLADQRGQNVEIHLEEIMVKSKNKQSLVQDVKETLRKLKRVIIKIDLDTSSFRVEEGRFLRHVVTKEVIRANLEKVQAIIRNPTLKGPNQIRSLFMQLTTIDKFIPKLAELKYPINKIHMRLDAATKSGWTNEAEEALQMIKRCYP
ncbi:hypothetical protein Tco_1424444 [Tanacetum coccineum]